MTKLVDVLTYAAAGWGIIGIAAYQYLKVPGSVPTIPVIVIVAAFVVSLAALGVQIKSVNPKRERGSRQSSR